MTLLAHQLRSPLSVISALAQGLARRGHRMSPEDVRDRGKKIWHASRGLDELIGTIMNYTRANAGGIVLNRATFNIKAVIQRICKDHEKLAGVRRCELRLDDLPGSITGDTVLVEQALAIVVGNAFRYSPQKSSVIVTGSTCEKQVTVMIEDKGIGIPSNELPFISQPFFRGANVRHISGTGLGLSLARHIVSLHSGKMSIESQEGIGTTVRIELPLDPD